MQRTILALGAIAALTLLAGCASGGDSLSSAFGAPPEAPRPPATQAPYPAVHDIPPARSTTPLSAEEQQKLERELAAARARQQKLQRPQ